MDDANIKIQITSKGEAQGANLMWPILQSAILFRNDNPTSTIKDFIEHIYKNLQRSIRRARENKDGTITMKELENVHEISRMVEYLYTKLYKKNE